MPLVLPPQVMPDIQNVCITRTKYQYPGVAGDAESADKKPQRGHRVDNRLIEIKTGEYTLYISTETSPSG
ncbi:MAG: hypothetical protein RLZZ226_1640 [Pseudomonadota bacterium]|jgi:hypothetical protein